MEEGVKGKMKVARGSKHTKMALRSREQREGFGWSE